MRLTFETCFPKEIQEKVLRRWHSDYGFQMKPVVRKMEERWMKSQEPRHSEPTDTQEEE